MTMATTRQQLIRCVEAQLALVDRWTGIQKVAPQAVKQWPQIFALLADDPNGMSLTRVGELQIRWRDAVLAGSLQRRKTQPGLRQLLPVTPEDLRIVRESEVRAKLMRDIFAAVARALCSRRLREQMAAQKFGVHWPGYERDLQIMRDEVAQVRELLDAAKAGDDGVYDEIFPFYLYFVRPFVPGGETRVPLRPTADDVLRLDPDQYIHLPTRVESPHDELRSTADLRAILRMIESTYAGPSIPRPDLDKILDIDREYVERQGRHVGATSGTDDECWPATIKNRILRTRAEDLPSREDLQRELRDCGITGKEASDILLARDVGLVLASYDRAAAKCKKKPTR